VREGAGGKGGTWPLRPPAAARAHLGSPSRGSLPPTTSISASAGFSRSGSRKCRPCVARPVGTTWGSKPGPRPRSSRRRRGLAPRWPPAAHLYSHPRTHTHAAPHPGEVDHRHAGRAAEDGAATHAQQQHLRARSQGVGSRRVLQNDAACAQGPCPPTHPPGTPAAAAGRRQGTGSQPLPARASPSPSALPPPRLAAYTQGLVQQYESIHPPSAPRFPLGWARHPSLPLSLPDTFPPAGPCLVQQHEGGEARAVQHRSHRHAPARHARQRGQQVAARRRVQPAGGLVLWGRGQGGGGAMEEGCGRAASVPSALMLLG
jgi:hypothetical protein